MKAAIVVVLTVANATTAFSQPGLRGYVVKQRTQIPGAGPFANFGYSLASEGGVLAAGAINIDDAFHAAGAVYLYDLTSGNHLTFNAQVFAPEANQRVNQAFGWSVDLAGDTLVVGALESQLGNGVSGAAYVFTQNGDSWDFATRLVPELGGSDIKYAYAGQPVTGKGIVAMPVIRRVNTRPGVTPVVRQEIMIFREQGDGSWSEAQPLPLESSVRGISFVEDQLFVRTFNGENLEVTIYEDNGAEFVGRSSLTPLVGEFEGPFAGQIATDAGRAIVAGTNDDGQDYVGIYEEDSSGSWHRAATFLSDSPRDNFSFGYELAIEDDIALVSARDTYVGAIDPVVIVFARLANGDWAEVDRLSEPSREDSGYDGIFGWSVDIEQSSLFIGTGVNAPGSVYTFVAVPEPASATLLWVLLASASSFATSRVCTTKRRSVSTKK